MSTAAVKFQENFDIDLENAGAVATTNWTSDSSGNYTETVILKGFLVRLKMSPAGGGNAPSGGYTIKLIDSDGDDVLKNAAGAGLGDALSATAASVFPDVNSGVSVLCYLNGTYTITIASAGNAKQGKIAWTIKNR